MRPPRPRDLPDSALTRLFFEGALEPAWIAIPGGWILFEAGEPAERLYFVRAGRFGVERPAANGGAARLVGVIKPGEPVGEMALIAGTAHTSTVRALRDSEVLALDREALFAAADEDADVMTELARLILRRTREPQAVPARASVFGLLGLTPEAKVRALAERVAAALGRLGESVEVVGREAEAAPTAWFTAVEQGTRYVIYAAEAGESAWRSLCARQVDRLFLVGRGEAPPPPDRAGTPRPIASKPTELILLRPADAAIAATAAWLDAEPAAEVHHLRDGDLRDVERLARILTQRDVALVFSGGGARAYAHVGAIKALREAGTPVDAVGGASMGAIVGASLALGASDDELERRIRHAFVDSSPLDDIAFPLLAMTQGLKVERRLRENFGEVRIEDLPIPFFAVSSNLTSGRPVVHDRGQLVDALRASSALPGVIPPLTADGQVLVDGAVMRNFPADLMRLRHDGPIVGVDVTRARGLSPADIRRPPSVWRWLVSGEWRKGPPIVSVLMSSAVAPAYREHEETRDAADLVIAPDVGRVNIRDWKAYAPAVEAGYRATLAALETLDRPVTELKSKVS